MNTRHLLARYVSEFRCLLVPLKPPRCFAVLQVGSVHVPSLMAIESFATVHQLVSTVRGRKRPDVGPLACVRAGFPAGSMTGEARRF